MIELLNRAPVKWKWDLDCVRLRTVLSKVVSLQVACKPPFQSTIHNVITRMRPNIDIGREAKNHSGKKG